MSEPGPAGEEVLTGGNTTAVTKVGETVRRPIGPWTPAVHRLLNHLASAQFAGAPEVLGIDERHREILAYVDGDVGTLTDTSPLLPWFRTPAACHAIGRWIKAFQTAQIGHSPDPDEPWRRDAGRTLSSGEVVVHHDVSPYNTVQRPDGSLVVLDWDFARPGDPIEDLAWAAWHWVPLMAGDSWHRMYGMSGPEEVNLRQQQNLGALLDGYQPTEGQRSALPGAIRQQMLQHASDLEDMARTDPAFANLLERGYAQAARDDAVWWSAVHDTPSWRVLMQPGLP